MTAYKKGTQSTAGLGGGGGGAGGEEKKNKISIYYIYTGEKKKSAICQTYKQLIKKKQVYFTRSKKYI